MCSAKPGNEAGDAENFIFNKTALEMTCVFSKSHLCVCSLEAGRKEKAVAGAAAERWARPLRAARGAGFKVDLGKTT